jgi:hypothetical protein
MGAVLMAEHIGVVMPVFDDWESFGHLVAEISDRLDGADIAVHLFAVDDGASLPFSLTELALRSDGCIVEAEILRLALNLGHQRAVAVGLSTIANRRDLNYVVVMDSDGEDRPADIAVLLAKSRRSPGSVVLARRAERSETRAFKIGYAFYKLAFRVLTGERISFGNFCVMDMSALRRLVHMSELWNNLAAAILRSRLPYWTVPIRRGRRYAGRSKMNLVSLIVHGLSAMSVYADAIFVRILLGSGAVALFSGIGMIAVAAIRFGTTLAIPGWATTVVADLAIILMQTIVMVVAAMLMMLAGRANRPICPVHDAPLYLAGRERWPDHHASGLQVLSGRAE